MVLKRKLSLKSWAMEAIVEAVLWCRGGDSMGMDRGFNSAMNQRDFSFNFGSLLPRFLLRFPPRSRHDRVAIGRRSW